MVNFLQKFANTSIDISDGLLIDLKKMIRQQKHGFSIKLDDIKLSNQLKKVLSRNKRKIKVKKPFMICSMLVILGK